jgi:predicted Mrr-cat superfamily restriction endonuclease
MWMSRAGRGGKHPDAFPKLRHLVVDFYDKLDAETRAMVPPRRLYCPAQK